MVLDRRAVNFLIIIVPACSQSVTSISRKHVGPMSLWALAVNCNSLHRWVSPLLSRSEKKKGEKIEERHRRALRYKKSVLSKKLLTQFIFSFFFNMKKKEERWTMQEELKRADLKKCVWSFPVKLQNSIFCSYKNYCSYLTQHTLFEKCPGNFLMTVKGYKNVFNTTFRDLCYI